MHGDSPYDVPEMMEAAGFCPDCHDHTPCGCDPGPEDEADADDDIGWITYDAEKYAEAKGRAA